MAETIKRRPPFREMIEEADPALGRSQEVAVLQVNVGNRCNMACGHCHVRGRGSQFLEMDGRTAEDIVCTLGRHGIRALDITGGAPELNPHFRALVEAAAALSCHVIARTNLTVFFEEGCEGLPEFYAGNGVRVIASLPCYTKENVDGARGPGVFDKSIRALRALNALGYGVGAFALDLVYNPAGPFLPGPQMALEGDYRKELSERHGVVFDRLYTVSNMPLGRFGDFLTETGGTDTYMDAARAAFNRAALPGLMCRHLVSVGPDGTLYDCDFNQAAGIPLLPGYPSHIRLFDPEALENRLINFQAHCYVCAAGSGST